MFSKDELCSRTIAFLRFPLIVAVVFIHTNLSDVVIHGTAVVTENRFPLYTLCDRLVGDGIARMAVPLFFFISGFLFFHHSGFSLPVYAGKLKRRFGTLLVPYVFWNLVALGLTLLTQIFLSSMTSGSTKLITDYGCADWFRLFWDYQNGYPICFQFWFIRDLMVVVLFAPFIYALIRYTRVIGVLILGGVWLSGYGVHITGFNPGAFFFFSAGAWFSITRRSFVLSSTSQRWIVTTLYLCLSVTDVCVWYISDTEWVPLTNVCIVVGGLAVLSWIAHYTASGKLRAEGIWSDSAFFIYAYHGMPTSLLAKCWMRFVQPDSELAMIGGYFLIPAFVVGAGVCIYIVLRTCLPFFTRVITGGQRNISR